MLETRIVPFILEQDNTTLWICDIKFESNDKPQHLLKDIELFKVPSNKG